MYRNLKCLLELTKLAILLETQKLEELCIHYIENAVCVDNVLTLLISANELHLHQLKEYCIKFVVREGPYQQVPFYTWIQLISVPPRYYAAASYVYPYAFEFVVHLTALE